jgi:hypothetical protein
MGSTPKQKIECLFSVSSHRDLAVPVQLAQGAEGQLYFERVVLDQEDIKPGSGAGRQRGRPRVGSLRVLL